MNDNPVQTLKGVGPAVASSLERLGIRSVGDLLEHYPIRYEDRTRIRKISEFRHGDYVTCCATVIRGEINRLRGKSVARLWIQDETGQAVLVWFNQPYRATTWKPGIKIMIYGKVNRFLDTVQIETPDVDVFCDTDPLSSSRIVPVYPMTPGLGARALRKLIAKALEITHYFIETIPEEILLSHNLIDRKSALNEIHFPSEWEMMRLAKRRIVFEELFFLQCALAFLRRHRLKGQKGIVHAPDGSLLNQLKEKFPFSLTSDQLAVYDEIRNDMENIRPMHRLLQGDVGSGKTAVALLALAKTIENGFQGVLMAPTEILAEQHYNTCFAMLEKLNIRTALLTGRVKGTERKNILHELNNGELDLLIGTHALLQPDVVFNKLGLVVTDEQHRFGVGQRAALQRKGDVPHVLVMSATPIPRTMALTLYGDMDVSAIRNLPPGRIPVRTAIRSGEAAREKVYRFLVDEVNAGRQGYVVCPLVEDSDKMDAQSATSVYKELTSTVLRNLSCGLLHGRMNSNEKEALMNDFTAGKIAVLVSTTVIEVGINVPNATIMIIEDAFRFGLAQLHQLRGRVGRGSSRSYCVLLHNDNSGAVPERLRVLEQTADGFVIAEKDLVLRGPGQFLGYRQHGLPEMKMACLADDADLLELARKAGLNLMDDPQKSQQIETLLKEKYERFFGVQFAG